MRGELKTETQVEVEGSLSDPRWGRCRVASAAAQEGICQPGEQLLVIKIIIVIVGVIIVVVS